MNNTVSVQFTGICTHVLSGLGKSARHRIVLVRADHGANIHGRAIPPHIPRLRIRKSDIKAIKGRMDGLKELEPGVWQLTGAALELDGVSDQRYSPQRSYDKDVPHLNSPGGKLPNASTAVTVERRAAAYFDVYGGALKSTKTKHGAVGALLTAKLAAPPRLKVTCFWNQETTTFDLRPGATIHIEHTGTMLGDSAYDFLLHYLIFPDIPDDVEIPKEKKMLIKKRNPGDISAGCSNSQYP